MYINVETLTQKIVLFFILVLLISTITKRDFYLPFLGYTVFPCEPLENKIPDESTESVEINDLPPNSNVIYWAAETDSDSSNLSKENPWNAYKKYSNSGVLRTNSKGSVVLQFRKPTEYHIPSGKLLKSHVHYRYCSKGGVLSPVQTISV